MKSELKESMSRFETSRFYSGSGSFSANGSTLHYESTIQVASTVELVDNLFAIRNDVLGQEYARHGRCVAVIDEDVVRLYGQQLKSYFAARTIPLEVFVCGADESAKGMPLVERIVHFLGPDEVDLGRDEPLLVIGGGVLSDVAGFSAALLNRRTPYIMVPTSLLCAVDAGPSPRTCVNTDTFKNGIGAYHPPVRSLVDVSFLATLPRKFVRQGLAEILKMAIIDDSDLLAAIEALGPDRIVEGVLGWGRPASEPEALREGKAIIRSSLVAYLRHEGSNLFELRQDRPHAFGHTWSPSFERPASLLHGHAIAIDMCLTTAVGTIEGVTSREDLLRVISIFQSAGLSTFDPLLLDTERLVRGQKAMHAKRGSPSLALPTPMAGLGSHTFLDDVTETTLAEAVALLQGSRLSDLPGIDAYV